MGRDIIPNPAFSRATRRPIFAIIRRMKRHLLAALFCVAVFCSPASDVPSIRARNEFEAAIAENPVNGLGIFQRYPFHETSDTPPPEGYVPFYISHYGRHGSRYLSHERELEAVDLLEEAAAANKLTDDGLELLKRLRKIKEAHNGMMGV